MVVAIVHLLWNNYKVPYHFDPKDYVKGQPVTIQLAEDVSFLNKASIQRTLDQLPEESEVIIDASRARTIHPDILEIFDNFQENAKTKDIQVTVIGLNGGSSISYNPVTEFNKVVAPESMLKGKGLFTGVLSSQKN